jgi:hypothetical protein
MSLISTRRWIATLLVFYGLVLSVWGATRFNAAIPDNVLMMNTRKDGVRHSLRTLEDGGPPLLACEQGYARATAKTLCYPAGTSDDQGIYLYLPYFAHWTGIHHPPHAMKWFFIVCFAALVGVYPVIMWGLFDSVLAGLLFPLAVILKFTFVQNTDIYWIGAWCLLLCLPLLLLIHDRWGARAPIALTGVLVLASFASSIRIHAGLPILLGALMVLLLRRSSWPRTAAWAMVVALAYLSIQPFGFQAVRAYRDHVIGDPTLSARHPTTHPVWHNMYIGLGHLPNRYGITWSDTVSYEAVQRLKPGTAYLSPGYERTLRDEYFRIAREDPWFVIDNLTSKLTAIVSEVAARFGVLVLLLPVALFVGRAKHRMRRHLAVVAPALPLAAAPPLLTIPSLVYQMNWLGTWSVLWLLAAGWLLTSVPGDILRRLAAIRLPSPSDGAQLARRAGRSPLTWLVVALAVGLGVATLVIQRRVAESVFYRGNANAVVTSASTAGPLVSWRFGRGMPSEWEPVSATRLEPLDDAIRVTTNTGRFEYQMVGPAMTFAPGRYEARLRGAVIAGGLELGVLDSDADRWLATTHYWYRQDSFADGVMVTPFSLGTSTRVRVILSNWNARAARSQWTVHLVEVHAR